VSEPLSHDARMDAGAQRKGGVGASKVVEPDLWEVGGPRRFGEPVADWLRVHGRPVHVTDHQVPVVVARSKREALLGLPSAMSAKRGDRGWVERYRPATLGRLGCPPGHPGGALALHVGRDERPRDPKRGCPEVEVAPAQAEHFSAPHATVRQQPPACAEAIFGDWARQVRSSAPLQIFISVRARPVAGRRRRPGCGSLPASGWRRERPGARSWRHRRPIGRSGPDAPRHPGEESGVQGVQLRRVHVLQGAPPRPWRAPPTSGASRSAAPATTTTSQACCT